MCSKIKKDRIENYRGAILRDISEGILSVLWSVSNMIVRKMLVVFLFLDWLVGIQAK